MSWICKVVGGVPVGAAIVGTSPALPVTAGSPAASVFVTFSFPPHAVRDVIESATIAAIASFFWIFIRFLYSSSLINVNSPSPN